MAPRVQMWLPMFLTAPGSPDLHIHTRHCDDQRHGDIMNDGNSCRCNRGCWYACTVREIQWTHHQESQDNTLPQHVTSPTECNVASVHPAYNNNPNHHVPIASPIVPCPTNEHFLHVHQSRAPGPLLLFAVFVQLMPFFSLASCCHSFLS